MKGAAGCCSEQREAGTTDRQEFRRTLGRVASLIKVEHHRLLEELNALKVVQFVELSPREALGRSSHAASQRRALSGGQSPCRARQPLLATAAILCCSSLHGRRLGRRKVAWQRKQTCGRRDRGGVRPARRARCAVRRAPMARDVAMKVCMGGCSCGSSRRGGTSAATDTMLSRSSANSARSASLGGAPARSFAKPAQPEVGRTRVRLSARASDSRQASSGQHRQAL